MWGRVLDFLYPSLCEICKTSLKNGRSLCNRCLDSLPRVKAPFCQQCGESFEGAITEEFQCPNCHGLSFRFDFARAGLKPHNESRFLIHDFKYRRQFYLACEFSKLLLETLRTDPRLRALRNPILVPVPLHWWRRQKRNANQAYEIGRQLSLDSGYPLLDAIKRQRNTLTQTRLPRKERLKNLKGAFVLKPSFRDQLEGKTVLLIDDVFTTGATAHECAKVLKDKGKVSEVIALTVMRG